MENCPELCPQREVAAVTFCMQGSRSIGKISKLLKIKCLEIGVLNSSVDFQECWQCLNSSWRWAPQHRLPCFVCPDPCPRCMFRWEHVCGLFNMPRQEGARVCCGFNIQGTRLCRTLQAAPSPAVGCSLRPALQSWMWHSPCTRVSQGLPGTTEKSWFVYSCFLYKYLGI